MTQIHLGKKEKRQQIIGLAKRHQRPGTGSSVVFLKERTAMVQYPDLSSVLKPLPWAVVGAVAARLYMPERMTQDIDIIISKKDAKEVRQKLSKAGFKYQSELSIDGSSWISPDNRYLDVVESSAPWIEAALIKAQDNRDAHGLPVLPFPYLVLLKFQAGRLQDIADISRMLGYASDSMLDSVRQLFRESQPQDLEDLESLIALGKLEMKERKTE